MHTTMDLYVATQATGMGDGGTMQTCWDCEGPHIFQISKVCSVEITMENVGAFILVVSDQIKASEDGHSISWLLSGRLLMAFHNGDVPVTPLVIHDDRICQNMPLIT